MGARSSKKPTSVSRQGRGRTAAARYSSGSTGDSAARLYNRSLDFLEGDGVARDEQKAFELNAEAARLGDRDAVLAMGWFYNHGVGVEQNDVESRRWYRLAARHGSPMAMFSLGAIAYEHGDFEEALKWLRRAVDAGHTRAHFWLGKLYWRGEGLEEDRKRAIRLFETAAEGKLPVAQRFLRMLPRLQAGSRAPRRGLEPRT
ncbi:MAG: tetratricopeptide repeat protein [Myxococcaceae bacterium]